MTTTETTTETTPSPRPRLRVRYDAEIRDQMAINLCRCGTHMRILRAVRRASDVLRSASAEGERPGDGARA